ETRRPAGRRACREAAQPRGPRPQVVISPRARTGWPRRTGGPCRRRSSRTPGGGAWVRCNGGRSTGRSQWSSTATDAHGCCCATSCASEQPRLALFRLVKRLGKGAERTPARVKALVPVVRVLREAHPALGAQSRTVRLAQRSK